MKVVAGMAQRGPALGAGDTQMGFAWWHWTPESAWMDWQLVGGRMRGVKLRWLCFWCDVCHFTENRNGESA